MNYVSKTVENAAIGVATMDAPESFDVFRKPGVAAAIWRRRLPDDFQSWMDNLPVDQLPSARTEVRVEVLRDAIETICMRANLKDDLKRRFLVRDTADLAERFARMMKIEQVQIRLDVVDDNACRKFHIDSVVARLVCTYRGEGTQYGISTDGTEPSRVFSVPTGSPILLRGTKWPEPPVSGLLHRSPPIEGTGTTRLVFVVEPVSVFADDF